jgi:hypothetical protein
MFFFQISGSVGVFHTPDPYHPTNPNIVSVLHIHASRPFQRASSKLCRRQGSKVIEVATDDKVTYKAGFFSKT